MQTKSSLLPAILAARVEWKYVIILETSLVQYEKKKTKKTEMSGQTE